MEALAGGLVLEITEQVPRGHRSWDVTQTSGLAVCSDRSSPLPTSRRRDQPYRTYGLYSSASRITTPKIRRRICATPQVKFTGFVEKVCIAQQAYRSFFSPTAVEMRSKASSCALLGPFTCLRSGKPCIHLHHPAFGSRVVVQLDMDGLGRSSSCEVVICAALGSGVSSPVSLLR